MKTSLQNNLDLIHPALFRIAAFIGENIPAPKVFEYECASVPTQAAFASLRSEAAKSKTAENKNVSAASAPGGSVPKRQATRTASSKNSVAQKNAGHSLVEVKKVEFHLEAPSAKSVKLAADFTDWEKFPLAMTKAKDGVWRAVVPLSPGHYSYRFIVDGLWCDDPRPALRVPNPFGTANAVLKVT